MNLPSTCMKGFLIVYFYVHSTLPISESCIKSSYLLFARSHSSRCVPSTLFQNLILMEPWQDTMKRRTRNPILTSRQSKDKENNDIGGVDEDAEHSNLLPLTTYDLKRLEEMRSRYKIIPILILDSMLPRQRLEFGRYVVVTDSTWKNMKKPVRSKIVAKFFY
jgi:hypothetical protein